MSTRFIGEGNVGSDPTLKMFPGNGNQPPRGVLRLNVRFDNPVPTDEGLVDRGGFWANVEIWGRDVEQWAPLYQRGQRVQVLGQMVQDTWKDETGQERSAFKVTGARVGILPYRVARVEMEPGYGQSQGQQQPPQQGRYEQSTGMEAGGNDGAA